MVSRKTCPECGGVSTEWRSCSVVSKHYAQFASASALIAAILMSFAVSSFAASKTTRLNENAFAYAQELIAQGHIVLDKKNDWGDHHAAAQQENDFIRHHGFTEYSKWHLGIDAMHVQNSKARFKFPFGDFKDIHRCALLAVKSRAHQYGYSDIENAAERLLKMMEGKAVRIEEEFRVRRALSKVGLPTTSQSGSDLVGLLPVCRRQ